MKNPVRLVNRVNFEKELQEKKLECEDMIRKYLPKEEGFAAQLAEAMNYSMEAGGKRLRPILMTSFAFICGLIPLMMASGAGALGNRSIGTAAAGGMLIGTMVGIFLVPGLYVVFESLATRLKRNRPAIDMEDYEA